MGTKLTSEEIHLIQYILECVAFDEKININEDGKMMSKRIYQIMNNLIVSEENKVKVDNICFDVKSSQMFLINETYCDL